MTGRGGQAFMAQASCAQARIHFLGKLAPGGTAHNIARAVTLAGPLDIRALTPAARDCARRHESLRTCFTMTDDGLRQIITDKLPVLRVIDLRAVLATPGGPAGGPIVRDLASQEASRPFSLRRAPLIRLCLIRTAEDQNVLLVTVHHIVADAWSLGLLWRELADRYRAHTAGRPGQPPDLPLQYADYAAWQHRVIGNGGLDEHVAYWREHVRGLPALELPTDRPHPPAPSFRSGKHSVVLDADVAQRLRSLGRTEGATLFMSLLAGFNVLLHRHTGQADIVVGTIVSGRTQPEVRDMIGCFVNMLVLRTPVDGAGTLRDALQATAAACQDAYDHQEVPFDQVVTLAGGPRKPGRHPLFQTVFQMITEEGGGFSLPGIETVMTATEQQTSDFELVCTVTESGGRLTGELTYATDLFDPGTVAELADRWLLVLAELAHRPDQPVTGLALPDPVRRPGPSPAPPPADVSPPAALAAPAGPAEQQVAALWERLTQRTGVGRDDNFFETGGHSLLAAILLTRVQEKFGVSVPLELFFRRPTVAGLAAELAARQAALPQDGLAVLIDDLEGQAGYA